MSVYSEDIARSYYAPDSPSYPESRTRVVCTVYRLVRRAVRANRPETFDRCIRAAERIGGRELLKRVENVVLSEQ